MLINPHQIDWTSYEYIQYTYCTPTWNIYLNFPFLSFLGNTNNCRDTFRSRYLSSKNDSRSQNSIIRFDRAFLRLCPTLNAAPKSPPLSSNRSNLWPRARAFFSAKKNTRQRPVLYDHQHSSRYLKDIWVLREVAKRHSTWREKMSATRLSKKFEL